MRMRITYLFADFFSADLKFSTAHCKRHWEMFPIMYEASLFAYNLALPCDFLYVRGHPYEHLIGTNLTRSIQRAEQKVLMK